MNEDDCEDLYDAVAQYRRDHPETARPYVDPRDARIAALEAENARLVSECEVREKAARRTMERYHARRDEIIELSEEIARLRELVREYRGDGYLGQEEA